VDVRGIRVFDDVTRAAASLNQGADGASDGPKGPLNESAAQSIMDLLANRGVLR
jgi:hypothetical protein